jgi:cell wall-associated NlpC family hydrolase
MTTRAQIIAEALTWVGTPWHRNQSLKGVGADCVGIVAGIALACGIPVRYRNDYSQQPDGSLRHELNAQLIRVRKDELATCDVLLMTFKLEPHHVALYIGDDIVHAYAQVRACVRQPFDDYWKSKVRGVYRFPGVTA